MYYEEKVIDGKLHYRHSPNHGWVICSIEYLTKELMKSRQKIESLESKLAMK